MCNSSSNLLSYEASPRQGKDQIKRHLLQCRKKVGNATVGKRNAKAGVEAERRSRTEIKLHQKLKLLKLQVMIVSPMTTRSTTPRKMAAMVAIQIKPPTACLNCSREK